METFPGETRPLCGAGVGPGRKNRIPDREAYAQKRMKQYGDPIVSVSIKIRFSLPRGLK
ncbi:MAG: hypothetical protein ACQEQO_06695 [Thermodesulfobacteriota bacterium]